MRLLEATDESKIEEIIRTELSTDEQEIDFYYIAEQMEQYELTVVGPSFSSFVLEKHWRYFGIKEELYELVSQLC